MAEKLENTEKKPSLSPVQSASFLFGVAGMSAIGGFGMMLAQSRKKNPGDFQHGVAMDNGLESGSRLALRALGRATVYSVAGFSLFCFTVWKAMGVKDLKEFTAKMQSIMPRIPPGKHSTGEPVDWDEIFGTNPKAEDRNNKS